MPRILFQHPPSYADMLIKLREIKFKLTEPQDAFLKEHITHRGIVLDGTRIYCRTCNKRDGQ